MAQSRTAHCAYRAASFARLSSGRRGSMLIIAIGVLSLLAVLGTTFVSLMKLERQAMNNYIEAQETELVTDSALARVISDLRGATNYFHFTGVRSPWLYEVRDRNGNRFLAHGRFGIEDSRVGKWSLLYDDRSRVSRYKTKVIDCAAQININGKQDSLARMLESLAEAIEKSPWLQKGQEYPLYTRPRRGGQRLRGVQIIEFRNKLEGQRFRMKSQLRDILGNENYETIKDFVTLHSWEDPHTFAPSDGLREIQEIRAGRSGGGRALGGGGNQDVLHQPVHRIQAPLSPEPRSPININTAPEEVLVACLRRVGGRRAFPFARLLYVGIDEKAQILGQRVIGQEETQDMLPRGVWVYMRPLEYDQAVRIARRIVAQRKNPASQFRTWSTGRRSPAGFVEFINSLEETFFPSPGTVQIIDPAKPRDRRVASQILGGGSEISSLWRKGHDQRERSFRLEAGLPYHRNNAFYYELCKATLIANFNPNSRINRHNPNVPAFTPVDKSDLVIIDPQDNRTPRKGNTTEFCFDSMGIYEITALGDLSERVTGLTDKFRPIFRRKVRTVVKVFDVIRHTNQVHFARTFSNRFGLSSRANRRNIITWPDPIEALTEVVSAGSKLDGRIELVGLKDGLRLQLPASSRPQTYRSPDAITMAHGFMDRDDQSFAALRRLTTTGAIGTREFGDRLNDVWDLNYSKLSPGQFRRRYRREEILAFGGAMSAAAINRDPSVGADTGSDLRPDGLHTSLFTTGNLGGKFLYLPAHSRIGGGSGKSGRGTMVGAGFRQNITGNVPYYSGGIAFWVKFEFNGADPIFSGLIGCTSVIEAVGMQAPRDSEGTQFYIFRNTKGRLRVVRMYYHQAFPPASGGEGGTGEAGFELWPPIASDSGGVAGGSTDTKVLNLDPRKPVARSDVIIDVRHFKAHEWHHLAVDWNDDSPSQTLQVWVDFEKVQGGGPFLPQQELSAEPTAWVRLNVREPRDGLYVGGIIREQHVSDAGVFKWFTNTTDNSQTGGGGGFQIVEPSVKRIVANATIDELVTYTGTFSGVRNYFVPRGTPGYFTHQSGDYANLIEIPLPPGIDHVVLRSFDWTSYTPAFFTGRDGSPQKIQIQPGIQCQVLIHSARAPGRFRDPWQDSLGSVANKVAGFKAGRASGGRPGSSAELVYRFTIPPGKALAGPMAGGSVQTPVIDDVTLSYFLAEAQILHQEEVE